MKQDLPDFQSSRLFMDRAMKWLLSNPTHLRELFQVLSPELEMQLDLDVFEKLDKSLVSEEFRETESDALFRVGVKETVGTEAYIYVLFEHQSRRDRWITYRFLQATSLIWRTFSHRQKSGDEEISFPLVLPLLVYTGQEEWQIRPLWEVMGVGNEWKGYVPLQEILFLGVYLEGGRTMLHSHTGLGLCFQFLNAVTSPKEEFRLKIISTQQQLETLYLKERRTYVWDLRFLVGVLFHRRSPDETDELFKDFKENLHHPYEKEEMETMEKTWADAMIEKGELKAKQEDLVLGLETRFGEISDETKKKVGSIESLEKLRELLVLSYKCEDLVEFERKL